MRAAADASDTVTHTTLLLFAPGLSLVLAVYLIRRHLAPGARPLTIMMLALAFWEWSYAMELLSGDDLERKIFWASVKYFAIVLVPPMWLWFAVEYAGMRAFLSKPIKTILILEPVCITVLVVTNGRHHLFWDNLAVIRTGTLLVLGGTSEAGFWLNATYTYIVLLVGTVVLVRAFRASPLFRAQSFVILGGLAIPWIANALFVLGVSPIPHLDLTPFAFTITGLALIWGLYRFRLFDLVPVARDSVFESMRDAVIVLDVQDRVLDLNRTAQRLLHKPEREALGCSIAELFPSWPDLSEVLSQPIRSNQMEKSLNSGPGDSIDLEVNVSALQDDNGRLRGKLLLLHDITERRRIDKMKSEFVSVVSHELRTPLTSMYGSLEMLAGGVGTETPESTRKLVDVVRRNTQRLMCLINDILDFENIETGKIVFHSRPLDILPLISQVIEENRHLGLQSSVQMRLETKDPQAFVRVDPDRLNQVMTNLLSNALKFSPAEGVVVIRVDRVAEMIRISIADQGPGIPVEFQDRIFQKFAQADSSDARALGGAGLGLSLSKAIIENMGGRIWFETGHGTGTTFFCDLPEAVSPDVTPGR